MNQVIPFILDISSFAIFWIIVPVIMISLVFISRAIINQTAKGTQKTAAEAGFWGGFILFIIYFIYQLPSFRVAEASVDSLYQSNILGAFIGICSGIILLLVLKKIFDTKKMVGFVTMILSFCGMASIYSYFFIRTFNDVLLPAILGVAFAVSLYVVISPKTVHDLLD